MTPLTIGLITYIGTAALGTSAQLGWVNTRPFRWLHHVLFALVWVTLGGSLISSWGRGWFWVLIPVAVCMAVLPMFKAGTRRHCTLATIGLGCYGVAILWAAVG
jgi:hypothetical protein